MSNSDPRTDRGTVQDPGVQPVLAVREILPPEVVEAVERGLSVIPCNVYKKSVVKWKERQTTPLTLEELRALALLKRPASYAIVTGEVSGAIIFDFDGERGIATMHKLGIAPHVQTGSGSFHAYIQQPDFPVPTLNTVSAPALDEILPGVDVRGRGGYGVFCGRNAVGFYRILRPLAPDPCTPELYALLQKVASLKVQKAEAEAEAEAETEAELRKTDAQPDEGHHHLPASGSPHVPPAVLLRFALTRSVSGRNNAGFLLATQLRDNNYTESDAATVMQEYADNVGPTDQKGAIAAYTREEAFASLRQAYQREPREPWSPMLTPEELEAAGSNPFWSGPEPAQQEAPRSSPKTDRPQGGAAFGNGSGSPPLSGPSGPRIARPPEHPDAPALPWILGVNRPVDWMSREALAALKRSNQLRPSPHLLLRGGACVEVITDEEGAASLRVVDETAMLGHLARSVYFYAPSPAKPDGKFRFRFLSPPLVVVRDVLKRTGQEHAFPPLVGITEIPLVTADGQVLLAEGYHPDVQMLHLPPPALKNLSFPQEPSLREVDWAKDKLLNDLLVDCCFADQASRANALGGLLTPLLRPAYTGPVPALAITAVGRNNGKSLLAKMFSLVALGRVDALTTLPAHGEVGELRKKILAFLLEGASFAIIDNIDEPVDSAELAALLTTSTFSDRILGSNQTARLKPGCQWFLTGNQLTLSTDLSRRCYQIMLDARRSDPENRIFQHPSME